MDLESMIIKVNELQTSPSDNFREELALIVNELINKDFQKLLQWLYRIDIDENKLRKHLAENENNDSALVITNLVIERQLQKIKSRQLFSEEGQASDEEKW